MIAFVDEYRDSYGVEFICRVLSGHLEGGFITSRGYRLAKTRPASARKLRDEELVPVMQRLHAANYGVYGYRKLWHAMQRHGYMLGRDQCLRLMRQAGIGGGAPWTHTGHYRSGENRGYKTGSCQAEFQSKCAMQVVGCRHHVCAHPHRVLLHRFHH